MHKVDNITTNGQLVDYLIASGTIRSRKVEKAFRAVDRSVFVPEEFGEQAYIDEPLPIGQGQTISQPSTVAFMLEILDVQKRNRVLDIGAGSGWVSALLSEMVGTKGKVYAYEIVDSVGAFGKQNIISFGANNIEYMIGDVFEHFNAHKPYDRIISGAAFKEIPKALTDSLAENGILISPTQTYDIRRISKEGTHLKEKYFYGFTFVPITGHWDVYRGSRSRVT